MMSYHIPCDMILWLWTFWYYNTIEIVYLTYIFSVLSPGPSTVSGTQKALNNILLIYADVYVNICACAFPVYEYVHINTLVLVYIFMFLHVKRCIHMYSSMDACIVLGTWVYSSTWYTCVYLCAHACVYALFRPLSGSSDLLEAAGSRAPSSL